MIPYVNIHTHRKANFPDEIAVFNIEINEQPIDICSVGVHPWLTANAGMDDGYIDKCIEQLRSKCLMLGVVAIGEVGLDTMRGANIELQTKLFRQIVALSEEIRKPLIIHQVKSIEALMQIRKETKAKQRWIVHGYRNKVEQARQLMQHGIELSFGKHFNDAAIRLAFENDMMWLETDASSVGIQDVYQLAATTLGVEEDFLKEYLYRKAVELLSLSE